VDTEREHPETTSPPVSHERRPLRVLLVTPRYAPEIGGVENHVREVARRFAASGCSVRVLTTDRSGSLPKLEVVDGVSVQRVRAYPRGRDFYFAPEIYRKVRAARVDTDVVHVQSYHTFVAPLAMLAAARTRMPYLLTFHGGGHSARSRTLLRRAQWGVLRPLVRRAAKLIAVARFEVDHYGAVFRVPRSNFQVVSNGVDLVPPAGLRPPEDTRIVSIGRLERYKGHQRVVAALPLVLSERPDVRLWIAGSGDFESELRHQAEELGVTDRVEIYAIPAVERERMAGELAGAALILLLSEYETQPLAILEAAALGRPALVADTSGLTELAERGLAVSIPLDSSPQAVAAAILEQLNTPHVPPPVELPSWDDCARELLDVYSTVVFGSANERTASERP
jgi:glycosyltransferase involved in cell wall biosynthesis